MTVSTYYEKTCSKLLKPSHTLWFSPSKKRRQISYLHFWQTCGAQKFGCEFG